LSENEVATVIVNTTSGHDQLVQAIAQALADAREQGRQTGLQERK
jgi:hypothetical protein